MQSYIETLNQRSEAVSVKLIDAFTHAGIPTSTFYRAKNGVELRYSTAKKVMQAIEELSALQNRNAST